MYLYQRRRRDRVRDVRRAARNAYRRQNLRPLHARERGRRERLRGVRRVVVPAVHALRARGRRVLRRL